MTRLSVLLLVVFLCGCERISLDAAESSDTQVAPLGNSTRTASDAAHEPSRRKFRFVYAVTLTELEPNKVARVWIPVAQTNHDQQVTVEELSLPVNAQESTESRYGNKVLFFETSANANGEIPIRVTYLVDRAEVNASHSETAPPEQAAMFLGDNELIPTDKELRLALLGNDAAPQGDATKVARRLYDAVDERMKYDKPTDRPGWGRGDAVWACDNKYGNCTDFHSLFISAARNLQIPASFEIGFMIPPKSNPQPSSDRKLSSGQVGGYHCWAKFLSNGRWLPVDISEADKHPNKKDYYFGNIGHDRVTFTIGRDLKLTPPTANGSVNFLVYPYAEVDGKQHMSLRKEFRYQDIGQ